LYTPHPRSGTKWKVYPLYDFAHCICDSLENITHSLCTLEFEIRRELYYWILNNLNLYKPFVYEFSRLNVSNNMLSKRKIAKLIEMDLVKGWDDPRLLTLAGLKKRGYTPKAINEFID
jgi:glutaminyl-tRNA synthetase